MHRIVDKRCDELLQKLYDGTVSRDKNETFLPLSSMPSLFKGSKCVSVIFSNGTEIETPTWKKAAEAIMKDCNSDETLHERLCEISGKVFGQQRVLLGKSAAGMNVPIKIDDGLYLESKFDTESLIKIMTKRILDAVGYDYSGICLKIRSPIRQMSDQIDNDFAEGFDMQM